jgi:ABC-2 type transport system permease protein
MAATSIPLSGSRSRWAAGWRSFVMAAWLGWQIESNWTDPFMFAIYSIIKPVARAAILVVMYSVITHGNFDNPVFPYIYLGNAFYTYVASVMTGVSWAVVDDREHYKTLKYIYIAPVRVPVYLLGRGVARFITGTISVVMTILAGMLFLNVKIDLLHADWLMFFLALFIGVTMLALLGLIIGSISLQIVNHSWFLGDAVAGFLFLFSGAIFPLEIIPAWLRPVGYCIPITYWLELLRRALVGNVAKAFPTLARFSNMQLLAVLLGLSILFGVISLITFNILDRRAREKGLIDWTTNY